MNVSLVNWDAGRVAPSRVTAAVAEPKFAVKTEPVSPRLLRTLPHPDRTSSMQITEFTADGRLVVSGYPSGVVQVLDPVTGKELRRFETARGFRSSWNSTQITRDHARIFVALDDSKYKPVQEGERKTHVREYTGEVRVFDIANGVQNFALRAEPQRGVVSMTISPAADKVATMEFTSGRTDDFDRLRAMYLWDVAKRTAVKLRDGPGDPRFSADGKTVYVIMNDSKNSRGTVYAYSTETGREVAKYDDPQGQLGGWTFRPDGSIAAAVSVDPSTKKPIVRLFDAATMRPHGEPLTADLPADVKGFGQLMFSPDGRHLCAVGKSTVCLWDVESRRLLKSWKLDTPGRVWSASWDATGRRLAASTWFIPPEIAKAREETLTPQDYPQPVLHVIDLGKDKPDVLVCPHGYWGKPAFSADGKLLAVGGAGAVHVFDVSK